METKEKNQSKRGPTYRPRATTQAILGTDGKHTKINSKWTRHYKELSALRDQILAKRETLAQDANVNPDTRLMGEHLAEGATDSYDRDWALSMLSSDQNALYEIEQALDRIRRGTYGICELSGRPIESNRLHAIPWTRFSADAQKELEANGTVGRTQLAAVGNVFGGEDVEEVAEEEEPVAARSSA